MAELAVNKGLLFKYLHEQQIFTVPFFDLISRHGLSN